MKYLTAILVLFCFVAHADDKTDLTKMVVKFRLHARKYQPLYSEDELIPPSLARQIKLVLGDPRSAHENGVLSDPGEIGNCTRGGERHPIVILDRRYWNGHDEFGRETLAFHELGHCILGRGHDNRTITIDGETIPKSIMNGHVLRRSVYLLHREYYLQELFGGLIETPELTVAIPRGTHDNQ